MRKLLSILLFTASFFCAQPGYCDDISDILDDIKKYLYNLGGDMGYKLDDEVSAPTNTLLASSSNSTPSDGNPTQALQAIVTNAFTTYFGSLLVNASLMDAALMNFVPSGSPVYISLNAFANITFPSYNNTQQTSGGISTTSLMDQQPVQQDPVNQAILNILGTPDYTYCAGNNDCTLMDNSKVMSNVIGKIPNIPYLDPNGPQAILSELNSNALTGPLLYNVNPAGNQNTGSSPTSNTDAGLIATTQAEQAANFVRYASGMVVPLPLMSQEDYGKLFGQSLVGTDLAKKTAQAKLALYLAQVRIYAAQSSVAISNMYYILSKRMPQKLPNSTSDGPSQAMAEMTMATRRMYDPAAAASPNQQQWLSQINTASPATVQKEMAILLSEINYQLYLNRQQDERLLLTNSLLLIQNLTQNKPNRDMSNSSVGD